MFDGKLSPEGDKSGQTVGTPLLTPPVFVSAESEDVSVTVENESVDSRSSKANILVMMDGSQE